MPMTQLPPTEPRHNSSMVELLVDSLKLADLQLQLFQLDVGEFWQRAQKGVVGLLVGAVILLSAFPVLLFGLSGWLALKLEWTQDSALVLVSSCVILLAGGITAWAARRVRRAIKPLRRSSEELRANLAWMRNVLHQQDANSHHSNN